VFLRLIVGYQIISGICDIYPEAYACNPRGAAAARNGHCINGRRCHFVVVTSLDEFSVLLWVFGLDLCELAVYIIVHKRFDNTRCNGGGSCKKTRAPYTHIDSARCTAIRRVVKCPCRRRDQGTCDFPASLFQSD